MMPISEDMPEPAHQFVTKSYDFQKQKRLSFGQVKNLHMNTQQYESKALKFTVNL